MNDVLIVLCAFSVMAKACETGTALAGSQPAACVNLIPSVDSSYRGGGLRREWRRRTVLTATTRAGRSWFP